MFKAKSLLIKNLKDFACHVLKWQKGGVYVITSLGSIQSNKLLDSSKIIILLVFLSTQLFIFMNAYVAQIHMIKCMRNSSTSSCLLISLFPNLQLIFVYVEMDNEEVGKPVSDYFGVTGNSPKVIFIHISLLRSDYD